MRFTKCFGSETFMIEAIIFGNLCSVGSSVGWFFARIGDPCWIGPWRTQVWVWETGRPNRRTTIVRTVCFVLFRTSFRSFVL